MMAPGVENWRLGSLNVGTLKGREVLVLEVMDRRQLDICCLQETRFAGEGAEIYKSKGGEYKLYWNGGANESGGVGVMVSGSLIDKVVQVVRVSSRIIVLRISLGCLVVNVFSVYAPQVGRPVDEKVRFYDELVDTVSRIKVDERIVIVGDLNGHVGKDVDGFPEVHGGYGFGARNMEGERVLEFCEAMECVVCNTCYNKQKSQLITYCSGGHETVTDYVIERRRHRMVKDVKVVPGEDLAPQHRLLIARLELHTNVLQKKSKYEPRIKVWKLRNVELQRKFQDLVSEGAKCRQDGEDVEGIWNNFKDTLLDSAKTVCGCTKGPSRHKETWWWSEEVEESIVAKRACFKRWKKVN
jgi:hypothetical protein